jgi:hypothetical protein
MIRGVMFTMDERVGPKHGDLYVEQGDDRIPVLKVYDGTSWQPCITVQEVVIAKLLARWEDDLSQAQDLDIRQVLAQHIEAVREMVGKAKHEMLKP